MLFVYTVSGLLTRSLSLGCVKRYFLVLLFSGVLISAALYPYVRDNYLKADLTQTTQKTLRRPYEDFFSFSSRPWYYALPSVKNPWLGKYARGVLSKIEGTGYFLSDDYFHDEHAGSYFGSVLLVSMAISSGYVFRHAGKEKKKRALFYLLNITLLFLFTLPPFFTISGLKIFTPGYLMYRFFPMFRVTSRIAVVILLQLLILLAHNIDFVYEKLPKNGRKALIAIGICVALVTLMETFVPVRVLKIDHVPEVYSYLNKSTPEDAHFVVYPYGNVLEAVFWLPVHQRRLINIRDLSETNFDSEVFTNALNTEEGMMSLVEMNSQFLAVFGSCDAEIFAGSKNLKLVKQFTNSCVFQVLGVDSR
ncbi:MAG: hypothetical protein WC243_01895 [Patescibacteria group bacterium]